MQEALPHVGIYSGMRLLKILWPVYLISIVRFVSDCRFFPKYSTASVINAAADDVIKCDETNKNDDGQSSKTNETYDADIKSAILTASLPYVNQHGWSKATIIEGAKQLNYPGTIHGLFPSPGAQLVQFFYTQSNLKLASHLKEVRNKLI